MPIGLPALRPGSVLSGGVVPHSPIGDRQLAIGNHLVDLTRFERAPSTFAKSRSHSAELQVQNIAEAVVRQFG